MLTVPVCTLINGDDVLTVKVNILCGGFDWEIFL